MNIQPYIDAFPLPARRGILSDINKENTEKALAGAMKNPATVAAELVKRLLDPGAEGNDIQARHLLHTMAVRIPDYGRKMKGNQRAEFSLVLAKSLSGNLPDRVKAFIIRQIQLCGGEEVVPAIGAFLTVGGIADDAAQALIAIKKGSADQFRKALPKVKKDILLYQNVLHGLAELADKASKAHFLEALGHKDGEVQLLGLWGLTQLADSTTLNAFLEADGRQKGFARVKAGSFCLQLAEKLPKEKAAGIYRHLKKTRTAPQEKYLQEIVAAAL
ncbi:MAG: hypothetical protein VYB61_07445 [Verrucomicrobiota bacterium]|nr:hypothetical protein [Verrucomicrobiota bacterium]